MRVVMLGTGTFAEPTFEALLQSRHTVAGLITQPDRQVGERRGSTRQTGRGMKEMARERGVSVFQPERINTPEGVAGLSGMRPELLVVAAYGQILSREVLGIPTHGGINVHASLLPKYRGAAPVAWAIHNGDRQTGVTIIHMSPRLDAGDMLAQERVEIGPTETSGELESRLALLGARMALQVVDRIGAGTVVPLPQDDTLTTKAPKLTKEHGAIDWSRPADAVCNHIRAMQPWPTAFTYWHRQGREPLRLIVAAAAPGEGTDGIPPGTVLIPEGSDLRVATGGNTSVILRELQPAGKRRMSVADFLRGHPALPGDYLGPLPS